MWIATVDKTPPGYRTTGLCYSKHRTVLSTARRLAETNKDRTYLIVRLAIGYCVKYQIKGKHQ